MFYSLCIGSGIVRSVLLEVDNVVLIVDEDGRIFDEVVIAILLKCQKDLFLSRLLMLLRFCWLLLKMIMLMLLSCRDGGNDGRLFCFLIFFLKSVFFNLVFFSDFSFLTFSDMMFLLFLFFLKAKKKQENGREWWICVLIPNLTQDRSWTTVCGGDLEMSSEIWGWN